MHAPHHTNLRGRHWGGSRALAAYAALLIPGAAACADVVTTPTTNLGTLGAALNPTGLVILTCPRSLVQHYESRVVSIESTGFSLAAAERRGGAPSAAAASRAA